MSRPTDESIALPLTQDAITAMPEAGHPSDAANRNSESCEFCEAKTNSRNLILCFDGTSNQFGENNTNVIELYSRIINDDTQVTYYNSGIGTYARPSWRSYTYLKQVLENKIDLAIAWNFERVVLAGYRWLSDKYSDGDKIFLFGFSRGAYQVRVLAGMIDRIGLILPGNEEQIPFAYELYAALSPKKESLPTDAPEELLTKSQKKAKKSSNMAKRFKDTFSRPNVRVHFIGVWDTVSSVGVIRGKNLPGTNEFDPKSVCHFRHALALDERRVKFLPEYVCGGETYVSSRVKEVWFAGCHSDIGGGTEKNTELNNAAVPVIWMGNEALYAGLRLRASAVAFDPDKLTANRPKESLTLVWKLFELVPFRRLSYDERVHTWWPHVGKGRVIKRGQKIHASVSFIRDYKPQAEFSLAERQRESESDQERDRDWSRILQKGSLDDLNWAKDIEDLLELDLFVYANVQKIIKDAKPDELVLFASTPQARDAMINADPELIFLRNILKDSNEANLGACAGLLSKFSSSGAAKSVAIETGFFQLLARTMTQSKNTNARLEILKSVEKLFKDDDFRNKWTGAGISPLLVSVIRTGDEVANEAGRVLYEYVWYSDGREAFSNVADAESTFTWFSERQELHYLLLASILYSYVPDSTRFTVKKIQLLTLLEQFTQELLGDQHNAEELGRSVGQQGFFETASANDVIQFLIDETKQQKYTLDVLSAFLTNLNDEMRKEITENLKSYIISIQRMLVGPETEQSRGLQVLSMFAGYDEMRKTILETIITSVLGLFQGQENDAIKYCASQALLALDGGDPQSSIPAKDIITWLVTTVGVEWRYQRTLKLLSEIVKNKHYKNLMGSVDGIRNLDKLKELPQSMSSTRTVVDISDVDWDPDGWPDDFFFDSFSQFLLLPKQEQLFFREFLIIAEE